MAIVFSPASGPRDPRGGAYANAVLIGAAGTLALAIGRVLGLA